MSARLRAPDPADIALAALFGAGSLIEVVLADLPGAPLATAVGAAVCPAAVAWRSVLPVAAALVSVGAYASAVAFGMAVDGTMFAVLSTLVVLFSVGTRASLAGAALALGGGLGALAAACAVAGEPLAELLLYAGAALVAVLAGRAVCEMGFEVDVLNARNAELARDRDARARAAVAEERTRIARELHDVIGHSISVMGVQAGAVRRRLRPDQELERETLLAVERAGRDSVDEMRRLLGFLRADEDQGALTALPTVRRVDELVADLRRAGLDVELEVDGDLHDLTPGRALAAFRILQEALVNVLKHAPAAHVRASVRRRDGHLEIEVVDDGPAEGTDGTGGHGLIGMRERVAMYGGDLEAGPRDGRGFCVRARLPASGA